jgi:FdhD protein
MKNIDIIKISDGNKQKTSDTVTEEVILTLILNGHKKAEFSCSGKNINELVIGYLNFHGFINELGEISRLDFNVENEKVFVDTNSMESNFANGILQPEMKLPLADILQLMNTFIHLSEEFQQTGAVHSAAIANENGIIKKYDDISRHNTLFMLLGYSLTKNILLSDKILLLTCRLTKSIMDIILKSKIRMIITKAAPTDRAVETCKKNDIALAGFVRENRMNIYHGEEKFG